MLTFVETKLFTRLVGQYLPDQEYLLLQAALAEAPESGSVIRGSGGVRKLRWGLRGSGKRGGLRVIYYVRRSEQEIWMLTMYPKSVADTIAPDVLRRIRKEIEDG